MKKLILLIAALMFFNYCAKHPVSQETWNHFWAIPEKTTQEQGELGYRQISYRETQTRSYINPVDIFEDNQVKYKVERRPLGGSHGETQFDFVLR